MSNVIDISEKVADEIDKQFVRGILPHMAHLLDLGVPEKEAQQIISNIVELTRKHYKRRFLKHLEKRNAQS